MWKPVEVKCAPGSFIKSVSELRIAPRIFSLSNVLFSTLWTRKFTVLGYFSIYYSKWKLEKSCVLCIYLVVSVLPQGFSSCFFFLISERLEVVHHWQILRGELLMEHLDTFIAQSKTRFHQWCYPLGDLW